MTAPGEDAIEGIHQGVYVGAAMPPHTKDCAAAGVADSLGYHAHRMHAHGGKGTHGGIGTLSDVGESPAVPPLFAACARSHRYGRGGLTVRGSALLEHPPIGEDRDLARHALRPRRNGVAAGLGLPSPGFG